jgi:hypothetical protein
VARYLKTGLTSVKRSVTLWTMTTNTRNRRAGTPAAALLAGGLSRHGRHCPCPYCRAEYAPAAEAPIPAAEAANLAHPIRRGALCRLLGGGVVRAYPDLTIGAPWDGSYRVRPDGEVTWRGGVERAELEPLTDDEQHAYHAARAAGR